MTKTDIFERMYEVVPDITKNQAASYVDSIFDLLKKTLAKGESVKISGFGSFGIRQKQQRIGRNPQTGEQMVIEARKVVCFKASDVLRNNINQAH